MGSLRLGAAGIALAAMALVPPLAGLGPWWGALSLVAAGGVGALWVRRPLSAVLLAIPVAFHAAVVGSASWMREPILVPRAWAPLTEVALTAFLMGTATGLAPAAALLLVGVPAIPAGASWASLPVAVWMWARGRGVGPWGVVLSAWVVVELLRAPCPFDAALAVIPLALVLGAFSYAREFPPRPTLLAGALVTPTLVGLIWARVAGTPLQALQWGVNWNPLAAQTALGLVLLASQGRLGQVLAALGAVGLVGLGNVWPGLCAVAVLGAWAVRRPWATALLAVVPLLTPLAAAATPKWLPQGLMVSYLARQYHWFAALRSVASAPLGRGLGMAHAHALSMAVPPPDLAGIPGSQMQHCHHLVLHVAEQSGVMAALALAVGGCWLFLRMPDAVRWEPSSMGLLFLWVNNGADLTVTYLPLALAVGLLAGASWPGSRGDRPWFSLAPLVVGALAWWTATVDLGRADRGARGLEPPRMWPGPWGIHPHTRCPWEAASLADSALVYLEAGQTSRADRLLLRAIELDPMGVVPQGGGRARVLRSWLLRDAGREEEAKETMEWVLWKERSLTVATASVEYCRATGRASCVDSILGSVASWADGGSMAMVREVARSQEDRGAQAFVRGVEALVAQGFLETARQALQRIPVGVEPWAVSLLWAKLAMAEGNVDKALHLAALAVSESGGADGARWELITVLREARRLDQALAEAEALSRRRPWDGSVWVEHARILLDLGRPSQALESLAKARHLGAGGLEEGIARAQALRMLGREGEARALLGELARAHPESSWPLWEMASWAFQAGQLDEAWRLLEEAQRRNPSDPGTRLLASRVLRGLGKAEEARKELECILQDPKAPAGWKVDARAELSALEAGR